MSRPRDREPSLVSEAEFRAHGELDVRDTRYERCIFDNCSGIGGRAVGIELIDCTTWASRVRNVHLEDCLIHNLKTSYGGGGRTSPFFFWGGTMRRVTITGTVGGVIWNAPEGMWKRSPEALARSKAAQRYYESVDDWALDVSEARFRSVPTLRFGPPGRLIRRDPDTQPLITIRAAQRVLDLKPADIGVWRIVLEGLVKAGWPDGIVLMPALGARKAQREKELAGLERLRQVGAFEDNPPD